MARHTFGRLTLADAILVAANPFIRGLIFAPLLWTALVKRAGNAIVAIFLRTGLARPIGALIVLCALTAILTIRRIETRQAASYCITRIIGARIAVITDDRIEALTNTIDTFIYLRTDTSIVT